MNREAQARNEIRDALRIADADLLPRQIKLTPALAALVDQPTAQRLYEEVIAELNQSRKEPFELVDSLPT